MSERERREKEVFLTGEQRAAKGFMTQASLQLDLLALMTLSDVVVECLLDPQLVRRTAHTVSQCEGCVYRSHSESLCEVCIPPTL